MTDYRHFRRSSTRGRLVDASPVVLGVVLVLLVVVFMGCSRAPAGDAFGNFEATDVTVSAQAEGRIVQFDVDEGDVLSADQVVGRIDTTQLAAGREQLVAQRENLEAQRRALLVQARATRAGLEEANAAGSAVAIQLETAERELERTRRLHAERAASDRELSEREGATKALQHQVDQARARLTSIDAQADVPTAQATAAAAQIAALDAQIRQIDDRIQKAFITNPIEGTVLAVMAREGETVMPGRPVYTVADLSQLRLRAYATGDQLPRLRLGMVVDVLVDDGNGRIATFPGTITSISGTAEFTPTPIQTRDERGSLVYAFLVNVDNQDGQLKIGMPGEVRFRNENR